MNNEFLSSFYGNSFYKQYTPVWHKRSIESPIYHQLSYFVHNPSELMNAINANKNKPVSHYVTTGIHSKKANQNKVYDRWFWDFDSSSVDATKIKDELNDIRKLNYRNNPERQKELIQAFQDLIVYEKLPEKSINEAKDFAIKFGREFGNKPALFFSGGKGAHAYCFFDPVTLQVPNRTFTQLRDIVKNTGNYTEVDNSVHEDVHSRKSRVPYTIHPNTGLSIVPFNLDDSYDDIMEKALNPVIEPFDKRLHTTGFDKTVLRADALEYQKMLVEIEQYEKEELERAARREKTKKIRCELGIQSKGFRKPTCIELADEFCSCKGESFGNYTMYSCPFHPDSNPSMMVSEKGWKCLGCDRKGGYLDFVMELINGNVQDAIKWLIANYPEAKNSKR